MHVAIADVRRDVREIRDWLEEEGDDEQGPEVGLLKNAPSGWSARASSANCSSVVSRSIEASRPKANNAPRSS